MPINMCKNKKEGAAPKDSICISKKEKIIKNETALMNAKVKSSKQLSELLRTEERQLNIDTG
ncbi:MAG: hypothetical protein ACM339_07760 [Ignavibacteria bacterium]